jgi:hypothetical protein
MKIAFLCSCLEPGRDGVGDYTRRLAGELIRRGHPSIIVGLNEPQAPEALFEQQTIEGTSVSVLRLPGTMPWTKRAMTARKWTDDFDVDWVSLQFVPFGFHPKGLPIGLARNSISIIGARPLHWMFHELWVLWSIPLSLRKRLLGQCQKTCIRWCLRKLKPQAIATQIPLYSVELRKLGVAAEILPLHGNIPVYPKAKVNKWLIDQCPASNMPGRLTAGFFGNILPTLDMAVLASQVAGLKVPKHRLLILLAGRIGEESTRLWHFLEQELKSVATFHKLGGLDEREASYYFSALDYGLTSYPPELMNKSGSVAAMREHGLRVICCGAPTESSTSVKKADEQNGGTIEPWTVNQSAVLLLQQLQKAKS